MDNLADIAKAVTNVQAAFDTYIASTPTNAVDPAARQAVLDALAALTAEIVGKTPAPVVS